jgi:uncharacterized protein YjbJ (UPF0337 family)
MSRMETEGKIDRARGRIRETWGDVTDDDFDKAQGKTENLIGRIKELTGDTIENIQHKLDEIFDEDNEKDTATSQGR